ncbi:butyrophilin subfamily 1 member A1-like isoform X2 [Erpetoichthys calabaricus]|uniref:butyrophilin subfamily 1 member A1-like isoform X2 n=1 Tax=Erpetoichthys calabaricus TaxID=27687 RepID=UPI0022342EB7|nr:butyrophilin subfamily 1 member A1-like isoform X2 [Erpetoichthys calabaricus]XP_051778269.1 butyrophilin subfamily 1 member A1-like isoform X2 [Erpetoichthys calabaricus]XP_051778270.1 butyrophilin subfamily 1 member A1-like isoform X2 [Erpetoichthys calabaricus]XP_051778271.1 butyrophilin subfamily 1 member A1-like isoform X2 [Erpetoichthys calabaricus]XP_051778272.1 butyrophilin subfamily 1 member A1-like isoform X2 [Erpetoichthys calabaricus]XP_051778273.1 butyrophilin subfamily 1 membe
MELRVTLEALFLMAVFHFPGCQQEDTFEIIVPNNPVVGVAGKSLILPCRISPTLSAVDMEITWSRNSELIYGYSSGAEKFDDQYWKGRVGLFTDELQNGNVSLRLQDVRVSDLGSYTCNVLTSTYFRDGTFALDIVGFGEEPRLFLDSPPGNEIKLKCESQGWFPKPVLRWGTLMGQDLTTRADTTENEDKLSLVGVSSTLWVTERDRHGVICVIQHSETKSSIQAQIEIDDDFFSLVSPGWKTFSIILILFGVGILLSIPAAIFLFKKSTVKTESEKQRLESENDELRKEIKSTGYIFKSEWEIIRKATAHVTLDPETAHPILVVSADGRHVQNQHKDQNVPDTPLRFDTWYFVLGRESFTSGQHYWEVDVKERADWWLGVVSESAQRKGRVSLKPQSGYWIVRLNSGELTALTDPETPLRLRAIPQKVGVYLDCDEGRLSFYSVEDRWHIYTFNGGVTGKLYPLFDPGVEGEELKILQPGDETNHSDQHKEVV